MELNFEGPLDIEFNDACQFELPSYVVKLSDEDIEFAKCAEDKDIRIIAAGADPNDQKITLITATNRIMVFDANRFYVPPGPAVPSHQGLKIFLQNCDGRWPTPASGFYVNSDWLLENSEPALTGATISTNYIHEADDK